jgi:Fic family protein
MELEGKKTEQTVASLATIWKICEPEAEKRIKTLVEIGFFQDRGIEDKGTFWVPFLYRDALSMSQGTADEG